MVDLFFDKITSSWGENFLIIYERFGIGKPLVIINKWQMKELLKAWQKEETNSAPNSQQTKSSIQVDEKEELVSNTINPDVSNKAKTADTNIHIENKREIFKDYKGCGEMIYGAWNDGDRTYDEPCDGVNYICEKCVKDGRKVTE